VSGYIVEATIPFVRKMETNNILGQGRHIPRVITIEFNRYIFACYSAWRGKQHPVEIGHDVDAKQRGRDIVALTSDR
jgi:hypothetical protein